MRLVRTLFIVTALAGILPAQDTAPKSSITGVVLDPTDAGVAAAKITLTQSGSAPAMARADATGAFRFDGVQAGNYEITVEHEGFKPASSKVRVGSRPPSSLLIRLSMAEVRSAVTVNAQASQVSTNAPDNLDTVTLNRQSLDDLPVFDQDYIGTMSRFLDAGSIATGGATIVVDGVESSRAGLSASAIQEVKINSDPYSAEYPRPGRSRIEIITKPGSSDFHGTFNFLFRDYHLNSRDPFALTRPSEQRRIFEGNLTGPLGRGKKMSFLVSANREEEDQQAVVFAEGLAGPIYQTVPQPSRNTEISGSINRLIGENHLISVRGLYTDRTVRNQGAGGLNLADVATNFEDREDIVYLTNTYFALCSFTQAKVHSRSDIFLPACSAEVLCFAPHILSLIFPVHIRSAAEADMAPNILAITAIPKCFIGSPLVVNLAIGQRQPFD